MRIFIGIKFPNCLQEILKIQEVLRVQDPYANHTKPDNIHMTLAFLGELDAREASRVKQILEDFRQQSFEITLRHLRRLRDMAVLEAEPEPELLSMQGKLEEELRKAGFRLERRPFYPHITLSRKTKADAKGTYEIKSTVREIILFSSERDERGLVYRPLYIRKLEKRE